MSNELRLEGVLPVLPTPFDSSGEILLGDVAEEVAWARRAGAVGVVVLGVASEVFRLSDLERVAVIRAASEAAAGEIPIVAGAGHLSTVLAAAAARAAVDAGAAALLVAPPPVGSASESTVLDYFDGVAAEVEAPIILQDDPVHLGVGLSVSAIVALRDKHPNCRYAKLEELPSMRKIRAVLDATKGRVSCLGGSGGVYVVEELEAGAIGIMTGFAFPEGLVALYDAWASGDQDAAREAYRQISDLARLEALPGVSLSIRKHLYHARGVISNAALRSPGVEVDDWTWDLAKRELERLEESWRARHAS